MASYRIAFEEFYCRFPGDRLAHNRWAVYRNGKTVASISRGIEIGSRWNLHLGAIRGMGFSLPEWPGPNCHMAFDATNLECFDEACRLAMERCEFITNYREACTP